MNHKRVILFIVLLLIPLLLIPLFLSLNYQEGNKKVYKLEVELPFKNNSFIQPIYTCDGKNINPWIKIRNYNELKNKGKYLAVLVIDPDAPLGTFTHWKAWNIPFKKEIPQNSSRKGLYEEGINDFGYLGYGGPCPPKGEIHHYYFYIYLVNESLSIDKNVNWKEFKDILDKKAIAKTYYVGLYKKISKD